MEGLTPAEGSTTNAEVQAAIPTTDAESSESALAPATEPSPAPATKPDPKTLIADPEVRKSLLSDAELRKALREDPDFVQDFEHRVASEAGRRAKEQLERFQQQEAARQAQEAARQERERLKGMDEYELGVYQKEQLAQQEQEEALQQRLQPLQRELEIRTLSQTGDQIFNTVFPLAQEAGATPEELAALAPTRYQSLQDFLKGSIQFLIAKEAKKLAKDLAKVEAAALVEQQLGDRRDKSPSPTVLAPGEPAMSDTEFLAGYAAGRINDHKRAMQLLGR